MSRPTFVDDERVTVALGLGADLQLGEGAEGHAVLAPRDGGLGQPRHLHLHGHALADARLLNLQPLPHDRWEHRLCDNMALLLDGPRRSIGMHAIYGPQLRLGADYCSHF